MLKYENVEVVGFEHAIRGMRNPMNSWGSSDSGYSKSPVMDIMSTMPKALMSETFPEFEVGPNDEKTMMKLAKGGPVHGKYKRMINVYLDVTAPLYWWKEYDTYKVGTVANSCSTMHKIHAKEFTIDDFSHEHLISKDDGIEDFEGDGCYIFIQGIDNIPINEMEDHLMVYPIQLLEMTVDMLNTARDSFLATGNKKYWWQMIQLLPSSYNQRRTIMLNYEVLTNIYMTRKNHKVDDWHIFCRMIEQLPHFELINCKQEYV